MNAATTLTSLILWCFYFISTINGKIFVPFDGPVHLITNHALHSSTLQTVKAVLGSVDYKQFILPKHRRFCHQLDVRPERGLVIMVADNNFEVCPIHSSATFVQILTGSNEAAISLHSYNREFISPRFRSDPQMIAQMLKSLFFDHLMDEYLGDVKISDLTGYQRSTFILPTWLIALLSLLAGIWIQKNLMTSQQLSSRRRKRHQSLTPALVHDPTSDEHSASMVTLRSVNFENLAKSPGQKNLGPSQSGNSVLIAAKSPAAATPSMSSTQTLNSARSAPSHASLVNNCQSPPSIDKTQPGSEAPPNSAESVEYPVSSTALKKSLSKLNLEIFKKQ